MGKRALICGISGQDGTYLAELLLGKGYDVVGIDEDTALVAEAGESDTWTFRTTGRQRAWVVEPGGHRQVAELTLRVSS